MRRGKFSEGAFSVQKQKGKQQFHQKNKVKHDGGNNSGDVKQKFPPCKHCKRNTHLEKYYLWRVDAICGNWKANKIVISSKSRTESKLEASAHSYGCLRPNENKFTECREVKFDEVAGWDWKNQKTSYSDLFSIEQPQLFEDELVDDVPVRGTRSLKDVYQRRNLVTLNQQDILKHKTLWHGGEICKKNDMIEKNRTWQLVDIPRNRKVIGVKWIFKTKLNPDGTICKHKARLVVKVYTQQYGVDYQETFAPIARYDTIKLVLAFASHSSWQIHQHDVKSTFLNGLLAEEIYLEKPDGFSTPKKKNQVYLLTKALYGLKQAPRA
ncbi:uncharacterized protein [Solanum lycopersicum]|uniref:uncharacterized protein n=1 Tax=Solanum lycopersicum TaxID=4081 RepID=UPI000532D646|nr:uncharacterized protein LOC104647048 [Solanum lycopersicum]